MKNTNNPLSIVLGIDPSLTNTGLAIFENGQLIKTHKIKTRRPTKGDRDDRLEQISLSFMRILSGIVCTNKITLAIETQFIFGKFGNCILKVAEVAGLIKGTFISWANRQGIDYDIVPITPLAAKKAVGMRKKLKSVESKKAVLECVRALYPPELIKTQDIADAVAIGHAALHKLK